MTIYECVDPGMSNGLYDYDRRYRRRFLMVVVKTTLFLAFLMSVGLFSYQTGVQQFEARNLDQQARVETLAGQVGELELQVAKLTQAGVNAESRATRCEERLVQETPKAEKAQLLSLLSSRLAAGISAERLAFVISHTENERQCDQPTMKRLVINSPLSRSATQSVSFFNGFVTVSGDGQPARDANNNPEAWFDPTKPVVVRIVTHGGEESVVTGVMPLHHSVVVDKTQYRFTIVGGTKSYAEVTIDKCPYP